MDDKELAKILRDHESSSEAKTLATISVYRAFLIKIGEQSQELNAVSKELSLLKKQKASSDNNYMKLFAKMINDTFLGD